MAVNREITSTNASNTTGDTCSLAMPTMDRAAFDNISYAGMLPVRLCWMPAFGTIRTAYLRHCSRWTVAENVSEK